MSNRIFEFDVEVDDSLQLGNGLYKAELALTAAGFNVVKCSSKPHDAQSCTFTSCRTHSNK
jgi:hypothetical protein